MSFSEITQSSGTVEECSDQLADFLSGMRPYAPAVLAFAMRLHLEALLQALLTARDCTREEVRAFLKEMEREALEYEDD